MDQSTVNQSTVDQSRMDHSTMVQNSMDESDVEKEIELAGSDAHHPAGEIMISPRSRIGARVSALAGVAIAGVIAVTPIVHAMEDTVSSCK
jgi:hypothetical protein